MTFATSSHPDRLFPADPDTRAIARRLFEAVAALPIVSTGSMSAESFADPAMRKAYETGKIARLSLAHDALADMSGFEALRVGDWTGRIVPVYSADAVIDPETPGFVDNIDRLGQLSDHDSYTWKGYLEAHRVRREVFKVYGARASVLRTPSARAEALEPAEATSLFRKVCIGKASPAEADLFRAVMLVEFAKMSADDGLALQLHAGQGVAAGLLPQGVMATMQMPVDYIGAMRPLLDRFGHQDGFEIVAYTVDDTIITRELGPLARVFPALRFGLTGGASNGAGRLMRYRRTILDGEDEQSAVPLGGYSDDITALPAQHETGRRADCAVLAEMVATYRMEEAEAAALAKRWASG